LTHPLPARTTLVLRLCKDVFMIGRVMPLFTAAAAFLLAVTAHAAPAASPASTQPCTAVSAGCAGAAAIAGAAIKWHPGQYMSLENNHKYDDIDQRYISQIGGEPTVTGILRNWNWRDIETSRGVYDFSSIDTYLKTVTSLSSKKRMIIRIDNRVFGGQTGSTVPDYLKSDPAYMGGAVPMANGVVARIWDAPVMDRYIALIQALAQRYDSNPYVEGISTSETAIGFSSAYPAPATFSTGTLLAQLQRYMIAARLAWAHSAVFVETNYFGSDSQMQALIDSAVKNQAVIGGPDVIPGTAIQSDQVMLGAAGTGADYRRIVAIKSEVQLPELGLKYKFMPAELYAQAYNVSHANYMLWDRNDYYGTSAQQWVSGILPFIRSVGGKTYTDCPRSYSSGCATN
jgi:hypothetical protein